MTKRCMSLVIGLALVGLLCGAVAVYAEDAPSPTKGTVTGILVAKGANWIEVKADGEKEAHRYLPFWRGGLPKDGGGYDATMLATIKKLVVPNRVKLEWELQEHPRIVSIEMVQPTEKAGTLVGTVVAKEKEWIEVKGNGADGVAQRYMPNWIGGLPKDGGGLDKAILQAIAERKVGDVVEITWKYDERLRVTQIRLVTPAK